MILAKYSKHIRSLYYFRITGNDYEDIQDQRIDLSPTHNSNVIKIHYLDDDDNHDDEMK